MKPVFLHFKDGEGKTVKTYTTCSLKTGTMDLIFDIAERASELDKNKLEMKDVKEFYTDLKALILKVFSYQFSLEELNDGVEQDDLMSVFKVLCSRIRGEMGKN
ncbi:hypothetical protein A7W90_16235 [Clostridium sp. Bc-iso-3]|nr:hypothetical protein A7W90_16235 [Clostridium sp. Bc-iso-3]